MSQTSTSDTPFDQETAGGQPQDAMVVPETEVGAPASEESAETAGWRETAMSAEVSDGEAPEQPVGAADDADTVGPSADGEVDATSETELTDTDTGAPVSSDREPSAVDGTVDPDTGAAVSSDLEQSSVDDTVDPDTGAPAVDEDDDGDTRPYETLSVDAEVSGADADATVSVDAESSDDDGDVESSDDAEGAAEGGSTRRSRRAPSRQLLEKEGEIAADFLETLLDICDLDGDIDVDIDGDRAAVSIVDSDEGRVPRRLVGTDGKVLDALQELTRLAVYSNTGERSRLILDIAGHRAQRRGTLIQLAQDAIAKVKDSGEEQPLSPMSAFERKIVHDEVLAAGLHSESDGAEPRRYVVVLPA